MQRTANAGVLSANTQAIYINQITSHISADGWMMIMMMTMNNGDRCGSNRIMIAVDNIISLRERELLWMTARIKCDSSKIPLKLFVGYKSWMNAERILLSFIFGCRFSFSSIMYYIKFNGHSKLTENEITESSSNTTIMARTHTCLLLRNSQPFIALDKMKFVRIVSTSYHIALSFDC